MALPAFKLASLARHIKPVVEDRPGSLYYVEPTDIRRASFLTSAFAAKAQNLQEVGAAITRHAPRSHPAHFLPTVEEVLEQMSDTIRHRHPVAFKTTLKYGSDTVLNAVGAFLAETVFYAGELPRDISRQPVIIDHCDIIHPHAFRR